MTVFQKRNKYELTSTIIGFFFCFTENTKKMDQPSSTSKDNRGVDIRNRAIASGPTTDKLGSLPTFFHGIRFADSIAGNNKILIFLIPKTSHKWSKLLQQQFT